MCDRDARVLAAGRGVFELTGYRDADLIGREVVEALALSDTSPIEVVREWGVRKMGQELEIRTSAGIEKRVVVGLLPRLRRRRRPAARADAALASMPRPTASAAIQTCRASARSSPSSAKSAVPAKSLRPSSPSGHAATTHGSPASGTRSTRAVMRPSTISPRPSAPTAYAPGQSIAAQTISGADLARASTGAAMQRLAAGDRADVDREPVLARTPQTKHSPKSGLDPADVPLARRLGVLERDRSRGVEVDRRRARLGDERVAVEQEDARRRRARPSSGRSSGGGRRSVTSTSSASTNAASRPHA